MTEIISTPKISEILLEEFMNPLQISAYRLAMDIHVLRKCLRRFLTGGLFRCITVRF